MEMYGLSPSTTQTRLARNAQPGDSEITVVSAIGWSVDDEIILGPTNNNPLEGEKLGIAAINGNIITLK